jgi:hypothetical protein
MQFKVPQFLDIEDKIFGPFTFREFVYLAGGGGLCFVLFKLLGFLLGFIPMLAVAGLALALTFYKPNNKPFINMLEAGFNYFLQDKLYIWRKSQSKKENPKEKAFELEESEKRALLVNSRRLTGTKLRDLAWSLDVLDLSKHQNTGN